VLGPKAYNTRAGLLVCAPITNQVKGYPFEVVLAGAGATGAALVDQLKILDWQARQAKRKGKATIAEIAEIRVKIKLLLKLG
jgi:mRNA interferase MazF